MRCLQKYTPSFLTSSNITLAIKTKAKTYKVYTYNIPGSNNSDTLIKSVEFLWKIKHWTSVFILLSGSSPGLFISDGYSVLFWPLLSDKWGFNFRCLERRFAGFSVALADNGERKGMINCPNPNTTFNLRRELGSFLKNVSRVYIMGTCEKDEIYKCYDVNYRISRISLSPLKLFSQYLFSFYINLRNSGGIKMYILLNLYKVVEYIYTQELKRRIF